MLFIWLGLFFELLILAIFKSIITDFEGVSIFVVLLHSIFTMMVLMGRGHKQKFILLGAYFTRLVVMFWDLYASHVYVLPNSGADSEMFFKQAMNFSENLSSIISSGGGLYPKITGLLFYFIGPQRAVGQYINVLLGLSVVIIVYKTLLMLEIDSKINKVILLLVSFFPNSLIMSAIFLREIFPTFFVAASLYFFIKWFNIGRHQNMVLAFIMLGIASMFHSGVIGILIGYLFAYLFYKKEIKKFRFSNRTIISFILIVIIFAVSYIYLGDKIFYKFGSVEDISDIYHTANRRLGGSAYLTSLKINNPIQLVVFAPLKSFFFLTVPLPMNWRGIMDVFTFFSDSLLYLSIILYYLMNRNKLGDRRQLIISILFMLIGSVTIFGIGVSNAGTAVRHRQKLIPLFLVLLGVMMDGKYLYLRIKKNTNTRYKM